MATAAQASAAQAAPAEPGQAEIDENRKRKLSMFLRELWRAGAIHGFKHIELYLRGKEELIVTVANEISTATPVASLASSLQMKRLPRNQQSLMLSAGTQRVLSGYGYIDVGLPPASPSALEEHVDPNTTVFLIAGYSRYSCPYVWVRNNHERLVHLADKDAASKDSPLRLKTTSTWLSDDVSIWDMIAELVELCTVPTPLNPFSLDFEYLERCAFHTTPFNTLAPAIVMVIFGVILQRL
ncbi:uncharacterized protein MONBRDRAFT_22856 [Monosiga brevicollis MX1]|uniref:DUF7886 domain-containing protein n=1 Tax=Monosiga brevicollis TaxID=81824 RepID=A9US99_MONBE|nr:uncharacterized protein MONBRDRAFT_22856 [Monosiga brevicollis MX1]EDQ91744.1 predicted protein [Monosiga brevicollis MX1]|eukprot:XP_001743030.1 hypothetical protein [Monosiga brevicollis MX1]